MTIVVWDGKTLAADRLAENNGLRFSATKIQAGLEGTWMAITGDLALGKELMLWYVDGADKDKYPKQTDDSWCRLIVVKGNACKYYENSPTAIWVEDRYAAWGTGRDFAYGALAMGADARKAVEIASQFSTTCGLGVDAVDLC